MNNTDPLSNPIISSDKTEVLQSWDTQSGIESVQDIGQEICFELNAARVVCGHQARLSSGSEGNF